MREQTRRITFTKGIRPVDKATRNTENLIQLIGLRPDNERLIPVNDLSYPITEESAGFPYPHLFIGQRYTFLLTATEIYSVDDSWNLTSIWGGLTENLTWHVADFAEFLIFTNGNVTLCYPTETGTVATISCFQYW